MLSSDRLTRELYTEICRIPLIDPHSHINPRAAAARSLDEILGYHYYTELAHSAGMNHTPLGHEISPRERVQSLLEHLPRIDNTAQYGWFLEIVQTFLGFKGNRISAQDGDELFDSAEQVMSQPDWEEQVLRRSNVEKIFLTSDFDDRLEGFDPERYIPCLRTDDLVFHLDQPNVRERFSAATGIELNGEVARLREGLARLFQHFIAHRARACAISLPPDFAPQPVAQVDLTLALGKLLRGDGDADSKRTCANGVFWILAEQCRETHLPFDLMIGVNRRVYRSGVYQGQDLFDQRTSLILYAELFNAFPEVTFPLSVLTSAQNQELVSYSWIFPNVVTSGHWWYSNIPAYIIHDARARLQAVPKNKQIGYYSDAYKLEFILPKYNMYRRILANILANDFVLPGVYTETQANALARCLLRENAERIFGV